MTLLIYAQNAYDILPAPTRLGREHKSTRGWENVMSGPLRISFSWTSLVSWRLEQCSDFLSWICGHLSVAASFCRIGCVPVSEDIAQRWQCAALCCA